MATCSNRSKFLRSRTSALALIIGFVATPALAGSTPGDARPVRPLSGTISPNYGNINPFWGNINPFYGNINPFWGNINPFYGNINPFWGNINPFYGNINPFAGGTTTIDGYVKPSWGNINPFWGELGAAWGNINPFWGNINPFSGTASADYVTVAGQLNAIVGKSRDFWGTSVISQTGRSFDEGFANPLLAKYGIDLNNPATLAGFDEGKRQHFFLDWYDGLMNYSGFDHADWWMKAVNWNPALTTALGSGKRSVIGILDFSIKGDAGVQDNIVSYSGVSTFSNGHGTAVASLMVAPQDGKGVMGIAPMASVIAYNPFDATGTASWADVTKGVLMLSKSAATIVNMSLGVPGWTFNQGWNDVFNNSDVKKASQTTVFVIAAGNDGVSQTQNVRWDFDKNPEFLLVGSVDPTGTISTFSNRPGTACLVEGNGKCTTGNRLMDRFLVAPGELILVSDSSGGVTRMSGTSFAAPLVSGTIALIHNRWPWLANYPAETVDIVLQSAKDLGAPGVDAVYGAGQLDATAAVSPLDYGKLSWLQPTFASKVTAPLSALTGATAGLLGGSSATTATTGLAVQGAIAIPAKQVQQPDQLAKWEASGTFFYAYEVIGKTYRDFAIPLSTKLVGQSVTSADGTQQMLQDYLLSRTTTWVNSGKFANGFASFTERGGSIGTADGAVATMSLAPATRRYGYRQSALPYQTALRLAASDDHAAMRLGFGDGAVALGGQAGLAMISDYDVDAGGANPLLGMASGGAYADVEVQIAPGLKVASGYTQRSLRRDPHMMAPTQLATLGALGADRKQAMTLSVSYSPMAALTLSLAATQLNETNAVLGVRSVDPNDLGRGSTSRGATFGANFAFGHGLSLTATATRATTRDRGDGLRNLAVGSGGIATSAYQIAASKIGLLDKRDSLRLSLSQPMHIDSGRFDFNSVQIIDRSTGELGVVTQSFAAQGPARQFVGELLYGRSLLGGAADVALFGRAQLRSEATPAGVPSVMAGSRMTLRF